MTATRLFDREGFEAFIRDLPAARVVHQWGDASVAKLGSKIFALLSGEDETARLCFKCSEMSFDMLRGLAGAGPAPYLARAKWIALAKAAVLTEAEIEDYVRAAHRLVATKLTRRQRAELGL